MSPTLIKSVQSYTDHGKLQIQLVSQIQNRPVQGAKISISYTGAPGQPLEQLRTNSSGQTETIELAATGGVQPAAIGRTTLFGIYSEGGSRRL